MIARRGSELVRWSLMLAGFALFSLLTDAWACELESDAAGLGRNAPGVSCR